MQLFTAQANAGARLEWMRQISVQQKVAVAPDTLINEVGGESVLLNLKNECYYGLDEIGTRMWKALASGATIQEVGDRLLAEYDVDAETLRRDLVELVGKLLDRELIELRD
jgi:Coenzyme PQQ synthesis protein D (PqqD)